ncbi:putative membrane protein, partial [Clostridioides difficile CD127]
MFLLLKIRKSGFISIECIISIAILYVAVYLVSTS